MVRYVNNSIFFIRFHLNRSKLVNRSKLSYQFNFILSILPEVLTILRELGTIKGYWGYFEKLESWTRHCPEVSIPVERNCIKCYTV